MVRISAWRTAALGASASVLLALGACSGPSPQEAPPPPTATAEAPPAPDLAGGPPSASPSYQSQYQSPEITGMAPIPNPEDMSPAERARVYGDRYDRQRQAHEGHGRYREHWAGSEDYASNQTEPGARHHHRHHEGHHQGYYAQHGAAPYAASAKAHARHRGTMGYAAHSAEPAAPNANNAPHSSGAPQAPAAARAADNLAALQAKVSGDFARGVVLTTAEELADGKPGPVLVTVPAALVENLRTSAGPFGLGKAARRLDISAQLSGDGYTASPIGAQVAHVTDNRPLNFQWQVQPTAGNVGPLKAEVVAVLKGAGAPIRLPLVTLEKQVKPPQTQPAPDQAKADNNPLNQMGDVTLPGIGKVSVSSILAVIILVLALTALVAAGRASADREREERRKRKAKAALTDLPEEPHTAPAAPAHAPPPAHPATAEAHAPAAKEGSDKPLETV
ncbi:MAG: hypothetical protein P4L64_10275 [Caulobacteraceae bacterium]|nr:hypothetical protein [Caulobacteraceae bacterium]